MVKVSLPAPPVMASANSDVASTFASVPVTEMLSAPSPPSSVMCSLAAVRLPKVTAIEFSSRAPFDLQVQVRAADALRKVDRRVWAFLPRSSTTRSVLVSVLARA